MHPQSRVQNKKAHELVTTGSPELPGIPARNGFNGFLRALPGDRAFFVTVAYVMKRKLDASVEASGPHDFAVRVSTVRQRCLRVHRIPCPTSVTIAIRPSCGTGWRGYNFDLGQTGNGMFLQMGLDSPNQIDPFKQIRFSRIAAGVRSALPGAS